MEWQTLAPELIFEVLTQFRADSKTFKLSVTKPHTFPWYLGHICRAWREVFVSSPQFWNTLDIDFHFITGFQRGSTRLRGVQRDLKHVLSLVELARISMVRSRNCPISFRLSIIGYSPEISPMCRQIIEILVANSARWRDAYIYVPANEMATIYAAKNRMPLLRSIKLWLRDHVGDDNTTVRASDVAKLYSDLLVNATQLTRISFKVPFWKINSSLITVIHFYTTPPLSQLLAYLSQMSCLVELVILGNYMPYGGDSTSNDGRLPITLPHLKYLYSQPTTLFDGRLPITLPHLKYLYSQPTTLFQIVTPALQELQIRDDIGMTETESALKTAISRYFQSIRHLSKLEIFTDNWEHAALIIKRMHRVDHLAFYAGISAEYLLDNLENYPQIGFLKTVALMVRPDSLGIITDWKRETGKDIGIGPFHTLTEMSFNLLSGYNKRFIDGLKQHLEQQGMHYSISKGRWSLSVPRFDVL